MGQRRTGAGAGVFRQTYDDNGVVPLPLDTPMPASGSNKAQLKQDKVWEKARQQDKATKRKAADFTSTYGKVVVLPPHPSDPRPEEISGKRQRRAPASREPIPLTADKIQQLQDDKHLAKRQKRARSDGNEEQEQPLNKKYVSCFIVVDDYLRIVGIAQGGEHQSILRNVYLVFLLNQV